MPAITMLPVVNIFLQAKKSRFFFRALSSLERARVRARRQRLPPGLKRNQRLSLGDLRVLRESQPQAFRLRELRALAPTNPVYILFVHGVKRFCQN